jgi:NADH-quinone oxidoreductase subunit M
MFEHSILNLLIWLPMLGGVVAMACAGEEHPERARWIAVIIAALCMLLAIVLYVQFDVTDGGMQFVQDIVWIKAYNIHYAIGVDGIALPLILLTNFTTLLVILASWHAIKKHVAQFMAAFLVMQGMMVGTFSAMDSILFYGFWEGMLIPMYLSIGIWGSANRSHAAVKFFLYTFLGSAIMLVALLYLGLHANSFMITDFYSLKLSMREQEWIFWAFLLAFAVKLPMWPVHTWLPDAHTEAPSGGSVVLAALMLKLGAYGFLRFTLPIVPDASRVLDGFMIVLALIAIIYIAFVALAQKDMKKLVAYSSIAHMGFVTLGCFMVFIIIDKTKNVANAYMSLEGAMVQMLTHALSSGAMFFGIGVLIDRYHSRLIKDYGGVANSMPVFAAFFMLFAMANVGLPGTSGFVGEFMIIMSTIQASFWITLLGATTLILAACYTLYMYKRVFFGSVTHAYVAEFRDVYGVEKFVFVLLSIVIIFLGVYPKPLLNMMHTTISHLLQISLQSKLS